MATGYCNWFLHYCSSHGLLLSMGC